MAELKEVLPEGSLVVAKTKFSMAGTTGAFQVTSRLPLHLYVHQLRCTPDLGI